MSKIKGASSTLDKSRSLRCAGYFEITMRDVLFVSLRGAEDEYEVNLIDGDRLELTADDDITYIIRFEVHRGTHTDS